MVERKLTPGTVFDTAVSRIGEIALGVVCAAIVHSLIFPKSAFPPLSKS